MKKGDFSSSTSNRIWLIQKSVYGKTEWNPIIAGNEVIFKWGGIQTPRSVSFTKINKILQRLKAFRKSRIEQNVSTGIFNSYNIKKNDTVVIVNSHKEIVKVGKVESRHGITKLKSEIRLQIQWEKRIPKIPREQLTLPQGLFVQLLPKPSQLSRQKKTVRKGHFAPVKKVQTVKIGGIKVKKYIGFFGTSEEIKQAKKRAKQSTKKTGRITKKVAELQSEDPGGQVQLFYGTNRNKTGSANLDEYFGDDHESITFGTCRVSIPKGHRKGGLERPHEYWVYRFDENKEKHIVLTTINEHSVDQFNQILRSELNSKEEKAAFIFIHGFDTSFVEAARRTAQITWDVPFSGITGFFSWPAGDILLDYGKADDLLQISVKYLQQFIELLLVETPLDKLHLIGHSMGARLMAFTIKELTNKEELVEKIKKVSQLVLAAPDIGQDVFKEILLPYFIRIGEQRTLYTSNKDKALKMSRKLRKGLPRLGDSGKTIFVEKGIDTVDASNVEAKGNQHSYVFEEKEVLTDLHYVLQKGIKPVDRSLQPRKKNNLFYWLFPS